MTTLSPTPPPQTQTQNRSTPADTPARWPAMKAPRFMHYNRLIVAVMAANLLIAGRGLLGGQWTSAAAATDLLNLAVANLVVAVVIRQQYVINGLFWLATRAPTSWPLRVRWTLGKVYHFGGIHVGAAVAATAWFGAYVATSTVSAVDGEAAVSAGELAIGWLLVGLLGLLIYLALPAQRQRHHDRFERVHRLGGWLALALFWVGTFIGPDGRSLSALAGSPRLWALLTVTASVALPWLRLRKVPVDCIRPSSHVALARFDYGVTPFAGSSTAISRRPLWEWHSFANVPQPDRDGFRLTISRAGDWTGGFIDDLPPKVWVKGIPTAGVANIEVLFTKVVYVATGSGIGPCLPHLLAQKVPAHLIWATRNPRRTYGDNLVDEIEAVQPDALIWDTDADGKPDLVELAHAAVARTGAEAVICISNKKLTWTVVEGMERRGVPAYGAIWDS